MVGPLYKNKGEPKDLNSYRGISVLPPFAKIFEKIVAMQITIYLNLNNGVLAQRWQIMAYDTQTKWNKIHTYN